MIARRDLSDCHRCSQRGCGAGVWVGLPVDRFDDTEVGQLAGTERPYGVYCGIDVGKSGHHACALDLDGRRLHDRALSNDKTELRAVFTKLAAHGRVLVVIDQPASIGALAIAVARSMGAVRGLGTVLMWRAAETRSEGRARTVGQRPPCSRSAVVGEHVVQHLLMLGVVLVFQ